MLAVEAEAEQPDGREEGHGEQGQEDVERLSPARRDREHERYQRDDAELEGELHRLSRVVAGAVRQEMTPLPTRTSTSVPRATR